MNFDDMKAAVRHAHQTIQTADRFTAEMAYLIAGRLQSGDVSPSTLRILKQELANYNLHTCTWKDK